MKHIIVGLTGPSGSGKSTIAKTFENGGYTIVDADKIARMIVMPGMSILTKLTEKFGNDILNSDGSLNRKGLAKKAFISQKNTDLLNSLTHPAILSEIIMQIKSCDTQFILLDAPQLFESGCAKLCDVIISVLADKNVRILRIIERDNLSYEDATTRINAGLDDEYYIQKSDFVLYNNGSSKELTLEAEKLELRIRKAVDP